MMRTRQKLVMAELDLDRSDQFPKRGLGRHTDGSDLRGLRLERRRWILRHICVRLGARRFRERLHVRLDLAPPLDDLGLELAKHGQLRARKSRELPCEPRRGGDPGGGSGAPPPPLCLVLDEKAIEYCGMLLKPALATVGYNSVVFAYGQTGSGKTFSMAGSKDQPGITPLLIGDLFKWRAAEIAKSKASERINVNVKLTYCEIYMEKVHTRGPSVPVSSIDQVALASAGTRPTR